MQTIDFFGLSLLSRPTLVLTAPKSELKRLRYNVPNIANKRYTVQALLMLAGWFLCEGYTVQEMDFSHVVSTVHVGILISGQLP